MQVIKENLTRESSLMQVLGLGSRVQSYAVAWVNHEANPNSQVQAYTVAWLRVGLKVDTRTSDRLHG